MVKGSCSSMKCSSSRWCVVVMVVVVVVVVVGVRIVSDV